MIPKKIHYVWVGPKALDPVAKDFIKGWQDIMPDYEVVLWHNKNIEEFSSPFLQKAFAVGAWNRVANYVRTCALLKYGGVYLDTDMEVIKPFDSLLDDTCFFGVQRDDEPCELVNVAIMGAEAGHWFFHKIKDTLDHEFDGAEDVGSGSGPGLVSKLMEEMGLSDFVHDIQKLEDITLYPKEYFYPYKWDEAFTKECITDNTYAIHHWDHTWAPKKRKTLLQKIRNRTMYYLTHFSPKCAYKIRMKEIDSGQTRHVNG